MEFSLAMILYILHFFHLKIDPCVLVSKHVQYLNVIMGQFIIVSTNLGSWILKDLF